MLLRVLFILNLIYFEAIRCTAPNQEFFEDTNVISGREQIDIIDGNIADGSTILEEYDTSFVVRNKPAGPGGFLHARYKRASKKYVEGRELVRIECGNSKSKSFNKEDTKFPSCIRKDAFYSIGGQIRNPSFEDLTGCYIEDNIESCNFAGGNGLSSVLVDSPNNMFRFSACELRGTPDSSFLTTETVKDDTLPGNILVDKENDIYKTVVVGSDETKKAKSDKIRNETTCGYRTINFCSDGTYELYIRTVDYKSKAIDKRRFNIMLGNVTIFKDVDLFQLTNKPNVAVQLIVLFKISSDHIFLDGVEEPIPLQDGKIDLKFCYSGCKKLGKSAKRGFLLAGYTIHKIISGPEVDDCEQYNGKACSCQNEVHCEYMVASSECRNRTLACRMPCNGKHECYRKGDQVFYLRGGAGCNFPDGADKYCGNYSKIIAVNFDDNNKNNITDHRGVVFINHDEFPYEDPENIGKIAYLDDVVRRPPVIKFGRETRLLYNHALSAVFTEGDCECNASHAAVTYFTEFKNPGLYEFSLLTIDEKNKCPGTRDFTFQIDGMVVSGGIDPVQYVNQKNALELNLLFHVSRNASDGDKFYIYPDNYCTKYKKIDGYYECEAEHTFSKRISDPKNVPISFHLGGCNRTDYYFIVSSFSVVTIGQLDCLPQVVTNVTKQELRYSTCVKNNTYYSVGGKVRKVDFEETSYCEIADNIDSRNLNGTLVIVNGEHAYTAHTGLLVDPSEVKKTATLDKVEGIVVAEETAIYQTAVFGDPNTGKPKTPELCAYREIKFCEEGIHELILRNVDHLSKRDDERRFNVRLGEVGGQVREEEKAAFIFKEVDIFNLKRSSAAQLAALFEVKDNQVWLEGQKPVPMSTKSIKLQFCYSKCEVLRRGFIVSGYSIHKLGPPEKDLCRQYDGNVCECTKVDDCDYMPSLNQCRNRTQICRVSCADQNPKNYRRGENVFYLRGGVVCQYPKSKWDVYAEVAETVIAVNFGTMDIIDYRKLLFTSITEHKFEDPSNLTHFIKFENATHMPQGNTELLYSEAMWVYSKISETDEKAVTFVTALKGAGNYELSIMLIEGNICWKNIRSIKITMGGVVIATGFDIVRFKYLRAAMELNLLFKVVNKTEESYVFIMDGYCAKEKRDGLWVDKNCTEYPIVDINKFEISFQFEECSFSKTYYLTGFSIVKLGGKEPSHCLHDIENFDKSALKNPICVKKHAYYSINGFAKKPTFEELGSCSIEDNIASCNFNGDPFESGDKATNNEYTYDKCTPLDVAAENGQVPSDTQIENKLDENGDKMYYSFIQGSADINDPGSSTCSTSKSIKFCDDGIYELSIRLIDYESTEIGQRRFNIKLADKVIFREVDIFQLAGKPKTVVFLNAILEKNGNTLFIDGSRWKVELQQGIVHLRFCFSDCQKNPKKDFIVQGFTMHKLTKGPELDECRKFDKNTCECTKQPECDMLWNDKCMNRKYGCRIPCKARENRCLRNGTHLFYMKAGQICQYPTGYDTLCQFPKNFSKFDAVSAVVFGPDGGRNHRNITFVSYTKTGRLDDPDKVTKQVAHEPHTDIPTGFTSKLYSQSLQVKFTGKPIQYFIDIPFPGYYELSIMLIDGDTAYTGIRDFIFTIGKLSLSKSIDVKRFRAGNKAMEIIVPFEITRMDNNTGYWLWAFGASETRRLNGYEHEEKKIRSALLQTHKIPVGISKGECNTDPTLHISGLSLIKYRPEGEEKDKPFDKCSVHATYCECVQDIECDYLVTKKQCASRHTVCKYFELLKNKRCYRKGATVRYLMGGAECSFVKNTQYCSEWEKVMAVNLGGPKKTDYRGIEYSPDKDIEIDDPDKVVSQFTGKIPFGQWGQIGQSRDTMDIYNKLHTSTYDINPTASPVTYFIRVDGEGSYELTVLFYDPTAQTGGRDFIFSLNGMELTKSFDVARRSQIHGKKFGIEMNILFEVKKKEKGFQIHIHGLCYLPNGQYTDNTHECGSTVIADINKIPLTFKKGSCFPQNNFVVSGLAVIKFK